MEITFNSDKIKAIDVVGDYQKSDTQSFKLVLIEKEGENFISFQKWWRKEVDENWREGKGFHLTIEDAKKLNFDLEKAFARL